MKYLSILSFSIALACPLVFTWTTGSVIIVTLSIATGGLFLRQHYRKLARQKCNQALAGNVDWHRYNETPDETNIILSHIGLFFKYAIPLIAVTVFILGMKVQALVLVFMYAIFLWQNHSAKKSGP